jgi:hypothetical protein
MIIYLKTSLGKNVQMNTPVVTNPFTMTDPISRGYEPYDVQKEKQRKEEEKQSMFSTYQSNYNTMFQRDVPKTVDFSEPINDNKIENMDSLIRQQQALREQDVARFAPPIPAASTPDEIKNKLDEVDIIIEPFCGSSAISYYISFRKKK